MFRVKFDEGSNGSRVRRLIGAVVPVLTSISPPPPRLSASERPRRPASCRASGFLQRFPLLLLAAMLLVLGSILAHDTPPSVQAQPAITPGSLDTSFDSDGKVTTDMGSGSDRGNAIALQSDGKILVAGNNAFQRFALARYNADGSLDTSFSSDGKLTTNVDSGVDSGEDMALQSDGKILVAGYSHNGSDYDFALVRYNADGTLDTSFGTVVSGQTRSGMVTTAILSGNDFARAVALQSDGDIVVAGASHNGTNEDFALARYDTNGDLDTSFGNNGKVTTAILSNAEYIFDVAVQSDGKIVAAGYSNNGSDNDFALARYNANGSLDTSFDTDGKVTTAIGSSDDLGQAIALQSDGDIVVAGYSSNGSNDDFALVRYNANGSLDTSFGTVVSGQTRSGKVITAIRSRNDRARGVVLQSDGDIVVAGESENASARNDFALARYDTNGDLDASFDSDGKVTTAFASTSADVAYDLALQTDGKIVAAGASGERIALARYHGDAQQTPATPTVSLSASPNPVDEGSSVTVTATLSAAQTSAVTIPVTITDNTAESGDHGALTSITINANATTGTGAITTAQDTDADHEVFTVALGTPLPTGITAGTPSSVRITIRDDEATGPAAIWSATLMVQELSNDLLGCNNPPVTATNSRDQVCSTHLSPHTFTHGGADYEIEKVILTSGPGRNLTIVAKPALPGNLVLVVDDTTWLSLRDAQISRVGATTATLTEQRNIRWRGTDFSWTAGGSATLSLVEPAAGTPTVSLSASPNPVLEGDPVTVTATLSAATASAVNIPLAVTDLSAEPADHGSLSSITIAGGATTGTGVITTAEDDNGSAAFTNEAYHDETFSVALKPGLPAGFLSGDSKTVKINIIDDDAPLPKVSLFAGPDSVIVEGESAYVGVGMSRTVDGDVTIPLTYTPGTAEPADYSGPASLTITRPPSDASRGTVTIPEDGDTGDAQEWETFTVSIDADRLPNWLEAGSYEGNGGWGTSYTFTIHDATPGVGSAGGQNDPCANCGTGGDTGAVGQGQDKYASLIAKMYEWRNDPQWKDHKAHTDRWDRALLAFGETVEDTTLTPMTAAEAQGFADRGWERWVEVAKALRVLQNRAPTVSAAIADVTIVSDSGSYAVSLAGVFDDADGDSLTISAASSDEATATASVSSDGSSLTVTARLRGAATITVTAADSYGGAVEDSFTVTVKAAPAVASAIADVSGLETGDTQDVSLSGVFSDADGDALTVTAASGDDAIVTVSVSSDGSTLSLTGVAEGTATITVTAQDSDGNRVSDTFDAPVARKYNALIARMYQWRNDPQWVSEKPHTDRWDRALLAFGETVADTTLSPMTADEAQGFADRGWNRWVEVAAALRELENRAPTVSASIADVTIVNESGTKEVSLSGVFSDADNDSLTVTAASSDEAKATVSVSSDGSSLTVNAQARGTAVITVTADDGNGGTVEDSFTVTIKAAPVVASAVADLDLKAGATQEEGGAQDVSLAEVFSDADGDALTFTAETSDFEIAEAFLLQGTLTVLAVADGSATITVTAQDSDGNTVSDTFDVSVVGPPTPVSNLSCVAQTGQALFQWDVPEWSGAQVYAYDYDLTRPDGKREQARLQGYPLVRAKGEYQAGQEASISVKAVYELADGSVVYSAAAALACTVAE